VRCAAAMIDAATGYGLKARAGIHAGEVEFQGEEVRGIAVHAAARILDVAHPGEVLVSTTVRDLLSGLGSFLPTGASSSCAASTGGAASRRWRVSDCERPSQDSLATGRRW
jgi:class 3 adenylate cyclase